MFTREISLWTSCNEFRENRTSDLVADTKTRQPCRWTNGNGFFLKLFLYFVKNALRGAVCSWRNSALWHNSSCIFLNVDHIEKSISILNLSISTVDIFHCMFLGDILRVKLEVCHHLMRTYMGGGSGGIGRTCYAHYLRTRWTWLISFTLWLLYPRGITRGTHWLGGWDGLKSRFGRFDGNLPPPPSQVAVSTKPARIVFRTSPNSGVDNRLGCRLPFPPPPPK
jgi:hypothetical protein